MKQIFYLFIILISILSCKKKDTDKMEISGQIRDPFQNIAIQEVTVDLFVKKIESGIYSGNYVLIQSLKSDDNGNFSFSFDAVIASVYKISLSKPGYFYTDQEISSDKITKGNNYYQLYSIYSEAYLKLHIKNNTPSLSTGQITFRIKTGFLNAYECCWDSFYTYQGTNVDIIKKCKLYGSQKLKFEWNVIRNNHTVFYNDSVFCNSFDTTFFEILY